MKRFFVLLWLVGFTLVVLASKVVAGVANTKHDMYYLGKGTDPNVCGYCHVPHKPHKAVGDKIWSDWGNEAQLTSGPSSPIGNMCYTCHDGTATNEGQDTVFNTALQQHKTGPGTDCNICHTVHDNTNGKFLGIAKTQSSLTESATYCETCHDATQYPGAELHGDHLAGSEHPYKDSGSLLDDSCNSCHKMHGAADYTTPTLTNPILKQDNTDSAYCATCHPSYVQATSGGNKHPANLASAGTWGKVDCESCHDPHQPDDPNRPAILKDDNVDSSYCSTCHEPSGTTNGPAIGQYSHPVGIAFTTIGDTPSGSDIDDDNDGADYPANSEVIVCESCHSAHQKGVDSPLLRITDDAGALCMNCHPNK
jgi:predicted CXXCH cytochrome family protein